MFSPPLAFKGTVEAFRTAAGDSASDLCVSAGRHTYVAESTEQPEAEWEPYFERYAGFVQGEFEGPWYEGSNMPERVRGWAEGSYRDRVRKFTLCGSPADVARRTIEMCDGLGGIDHFWGYFDISDMPTDALVRSVELYARGRDPPLA